MSLVYILTYSVTVHVCSQAGITPRLVNPFGKKTLIKLAGITEMAAHMQEACSRSRPLKRLDLAGMHGQWRNIHIGTRARTFACSAWNNCIPKHDGYIHTYPHTNIHRKYFWDAMRNSINNELETLGRNHSSTHYGYRFSSLTLSLLAILTNISFFQCFCTLWCWNWIRCNWYDAAKESTWKCYYWKFMITPRMSL